MEAAPVAVARTVGDVKEELMEAVLLDSLLQVRDLHQRQVFM